MLKDTKEEGTAARLLKFPSRLRGRLDQGVPTVASNWGSKESVWDQSSQQRCCISRYCS
jgi:hypothetical protein